MNRKDVKIIMLQKDISFSLLAKETQVNLITIYNIMNGRGISRRIEDHISERFGFPFEKVSEAWKNDPERSRAGVK